jgi:hypothetical protein
MNVDLSPEEVYALIAWHEDEAEGHEETWDADYREEGRRHIARADELFFMLTGATRKPTKSKEGQ